VEIDLARAGIDDLEAVRRFGRRVVGGYYEQIGIPEFGASMLAEHWEGPSQEQAIVDGRVVLARCETELVGVAEFDTYEGEPVVWKLYVDESLRNRGVGRRLLAEVERLLPPGSGSVLIEHAAENSLAALAYERLGFEVAWIDEGAAPGATTVWRRRVLADRP